MLSVPSEPSTESNEVQVMLLRVSDKDVTFDNSSEGVPIKAGQGVLDVEWLCSPSGRCRGWQF